MKRILRSLCTALALIISTTCFMSIKASAETNYNLKIKGSVNLTNASYLTGENFCRIFVEKKGYLTLTVNSGSEVSYVFCDSNKSALFTNRDCLNDINGKKITYAVDRGSYYLSQISSKGTNVKLSASFSTAYKLSKGKKTTVYSRNCGQYFYLKVVPDVTGVLNVYTTPSSSGNVTLCNSKKKPVSSTQKLEYGIDKKFTFGVQKKKTYYIRVESQDVLTVKYTTKAYKDTGASNRTKGTILKQSKTYSGLIYAGRSSESWYRMKTKESQIISLDIKGFSYDGINVAMYDKNYNELLNYTIFTDINGTYTLNTGAAYPEGTYYICVKRADPLSSGWYSLKWH